MKSLLNKSTTPPETREELADLFWSSGAAEHMFSGKHGRAQCVLWRAPLRLEDFRQWVDDDSASLPYPHEYIFQLEAFTFAEERWFFVACRRLIVVAPFLDPETAGIDWPKHPEDIERV